VEKVVKRKGWLGFILIWLWDKFIAVSKKSNELPK